MKNLFLTTVLFFFVIICNSQSISKINWEKDLDFYKSELEKRHIDIYNKINKKEFESDIQKIKSNLSKKNDTEVIIDLMRLTRKIGDGHTAVSLRNMERHFYPVEVYYVNGKWRVIKVAIEYKKILGYELTMIDGKDICEIADKVSPIAQYVENEHSQIIRTGEYLILSELLFGLGITKNEYKAIFTFQDNENVSNIEINAVNNEVFYNSTHFSNLEVNIPEISKPQEADHNFLWFSPIEGTKGIYIKFESYPLFKEMESFGEKVLKYINENSIEKLVIDMRNNGGGDFFVGLFLAYYLNLADSIDWKSGVYLLVDKGTFSAGVSNAAQFRQILNAKIVGKPTGSNPTGYQDMGQFQLLNSGLTITYSKRFFRFQKRVTQGVQPDVLIEYNWNDFSTGKDNMMEWVIDQIKE